MAGDVIIFHPGQGIGRKSILGDDVFIKRVVAVEGDELEVGWSLFLGGSMAVGVRLAVAESRGAESGPLPSHRIHQSTTPPQVKGGKLIVNGSPRAEPFINEPPAYTLDKLVVPPGDVSPGGGGGKGGRVFF